MNNIVQKTNIRTMQKDLKQLREADTIKENKKIFTAPISATVPDTVIAPKPATAIKTDPLKTLLAQKKVTEEKNIQDAKIFATEEEKQRIFLLEKQKLELQEKAKQKETISPSELVLQKNEILLAQKNTEEKLKPLVDQETIIEQKQLAVEEKEKLINVPAEKQELEKERWSLEDQRQNIEKKRWQLENELAKLDQEMKAINDKYEVIQTNKNSTNKEIEDADLKLREVYVNVVERENKKRDELSGRQQSTVEENQKAIKTAEENKKIQAKIQPAVAKKEEFIREIPAEIKESLAIANNAEEIRRKKFMEDIEQWAQSNKNNTTNNE